MIFNNDLLNLILLILLFKTFYDSSLKYVKSRVFHSPPTKVKKFNDLNDYNIIQKKYNDIEYFNDKKEDILTIDEIINIKDMLTFDDYKKLNKSAKDSIKDPDEFIESNETYKFPIFASDPQSWKELIPDKIRVPKVYTNEKYYEMHS